jgi:nucleotide-binding universal stress UspA family protein
MANQSRPVIVAGYDGRASGDDALAFGRVLAEATGAVLVVAHVYPYDTGPLPPPSEPQVQKKLRSVAFAELRRARTILAGFERWEPCAVAAVPSARGLLELARERAADMIVVGTTHQHGVGHAIPGATTSKILHGAPCAVAVAPAGWSAAAERPLREIGAGYDGSPASQSALEAAARLARATGAALRVIAAFERPSPDDIWFAVTSKGYGEIVGELRADLATVLDGAAARLDDDVRTTTRLTDGYPVDVLAGASESLDLLVVGSRGYGPIRAVMPGSVTAALLPRARCPLLVVPLGVDEPLGGVAAAPPAQSKAEA